MHKKLSKSVRISYTTAKWPSCCNRVPWVEEALARHASLRTVVYPNEYGVSTIQGGAGFLPPTQPVQTCPRCVSPVSLVGLCGSATVA